jgi:hypothetical protein
VSRLTNLARQKMIPRLTGIGFVLLAYAGAGWGKTRKPTEVLPDSEYAGSQACLECHSDKATALKTPMGRALALPQDAETLRARPWLGFRNGPYSYDIMTTANGSNCFVTDGKRTISAPIVWAVGNGSVGQTYILQYGRRYVESQVSYYAESRALDTTVGHNPQPPHDLEEAMGSPIPEPALRQCLNCHATSAERDGRLTLNQMSPGIGCERCHGPGAAHIAAVKAGNLGNLQIINPGHFSVSKATAFCASCHRTRQDVKQFSVPGVGTVRFQAYRLEQSRCYNQDDARLTCTACHNPHLVLEATAISYDSRCLACHDGSIETAHRCSVGTHDCVSCHMPKVRVRQANATFTDHRIRIAKPGEPYPN